jgi:hypothetical protein
MRVGSDICAQWPPPADRDSRPLVPKSTDATELPNVPLLAARHADRHTRAVWISGRVRCRSLPLSLFSTGWYGPILLRLVPLLAGAGMVTTRDCPRNSPHESAVRSAPGGYRRPGRPVALTGGRSGAGTVTGRQQRQPGSLLAWGTGWDGGWGAGCVLLVQDRFRPVMAAAAERL